MGRKHFGVAFAALGAGLGASVYAMQAEPLPPPPPGTENLRPPPANPTDEQRLASFKAANEAPHMLVTFVRPLQEGQIEALLNRVEAKPYKVFMYLEGLAGTHSVKPAQAGVGVVANARSISFQQVQEIDAGYNSQFADIAKASVPASPDALEVTRDMLRKSEQNDAMTKAFRTGIPITYATTVIAPEAAIAALRASNQVKSVQIGYRLDNGRAIVSVPELPSGSKLRFESARVKALSAVQVLEEVKAKGSKR